MGVRGVLKQRWYQAGLCFSCVGCGNCCAGPGEGYVWVTKEDIAAMAPELGMEEEAFRQMYVRRVGVKYSLREMDGSKDCVFLTEAVDGKRGCQVYNARPLLS